METEPNPMIDKVTELGRKVLAHTVLGYIVHDRYDSEGNYIEVEYGQERDIQRT